MSTNQGTDLKKFLFDNNDFGKPLNEEPPEPVYNQAELEAARAESFAAGKQEGIRETRQNQEETANAALARLGGLMETVIAAEDRRHVELLGNAARLAFDVAKKILPAGLAHFGHAEIESVVAKTLEAHKDESTIVITVAESDLLALTPRFDTLVTTHGFKGKLTVKGDSTLLPGDCTVDWNHGGVERLYARLIEKIEKTFAEAIDGLNRQTDTSDTHQQ